MKSHKFDDKKRSEEFFPLYIASQKRIFSYILMMVPNVNDAEEILQEVSSLLWQKFDDYKPGTHFAAWGVKIAHNKIYEYSRSKRKYHLLFEGEFLEICADKAEKSSQLFDSRLKVLNECVQKLSDKDRELLKYRYENGLTIKKIAEEVGRTAHGLYKVMTRIHKNLSQCVRRTIAQQQ
ncbi:MAG: sigma-70 family RNA polymerase sigma factor [Phycisphaerae bacterium]|nr:sigma-70 family RNA polymerase sigma factor [Phycisphaerae bacterium]